MRSWEFQYQNTLDRWEYNPPHRPLLTWLRKEQMMTWHSEICLQRDFWIKNLAKIAGKHFRHHPHPPKTIRGLPGLPGLPKKKNSQTKVEDDNNCVTECHRSIRDRAIAMYKRCTVASDREFRSDCTDGLERYAHAFQQHTMSAMPCAYCACAWHSWH